MATVHVYRLEPRSPFHFGERGVGVEETAEIFRSDSLFSALCSVVREGWGVDALRELLTAFQYPEAAPFRISSCFPYAGDVLFFPRPMLAPSLEYQPEAAKRLKRTRFVSRDLFFAWLAGQELGAETQGENFLSQSGAWLSGAERGRLAGLPSAGGASENAGPAFWWKADVPRVTVDRTTNASAVYRCGRVAFREGSGLYFLAHWRDPALQRLVEQSLWILGDAGIGGRRSSGHGQFRPLPAETLDLPDAQEPGALLTLALYWPAAHEIAAGVLNEPARYDLVSRYGWMSSPDGRALRRKEVRMVTEGSLLAPVAPALGGLVDVTPDGFTTHPVYRYGLAFVLPVPATEAHSE